MYLMIGTRYNTIVVRCRWYVWHLLWKGVICVAFYVARILIAIFLLTKISKKCNANQVQRLWVCSLMQNDVSWNWITLDWQNSRRESCKIPSCIRNISSANYKICQIDFRTKDTMWFNNPSESKIITIGRIKCSYQF